VSVTAAQACCGFRVRMRCGNSADGALHAKKRVVSRSITGKVFHRI